MEREYRVAVMFNPENPEGFNMMLIQAEVKADFWALGFQEECEYEDFQRIGSQATVYADGALVTFTYRFI